MNAEQLERLEYLFFRYFDGSISKEEMDELNSAMLKSEHVRYKYFDSLKAELALNYCMERNIQPDVSAVLLFEELKKMADYEKTAPEAEMLQEIPQIELIQKINKEKIEHKIKRGPLLTIITSVAALLAMIIYVYLSGPAPYEMATVSDSIDAKWSSRLNVKPGTRLSSDTKPIQLTQGIVELMTDSGVKVVLEAPTEFSFISYSEIALNYGKLFAYVSGQGCGFSVNTPNAKVVDLGTEFGVIAQIDGNTEVYMYKGRANLFAGQDGENPVSRLLSAGSANKVDRLNSVVKQIPMQEDIVIRDIDSKNKFVWRGGNIDLANILGGENGFDAPSFFVNIDFRRNIYMKKTPRQQSEAFSNKPQYVPVKERSFVDGAFVPDGGDGDVQIASNGLTYNEFPNSSSEFMKPTQGNPAQKINNEGSLSQSNYFLLEAEPLPEDEPSCIRLHCNTGITFDLEAIRKANPGVRISGFKSGFNVADEFNKELRGDIIILVDGKERFVHLNYSQEDGPLDIQFEFNDADRFLTIVCTEGVSTGNWPLFIKPVLELEAALN